MESVYGLLQSRMRVSMGGGTGRSLISLMSRCISSAFTMRPRVMEAISCISAVLTGLPIFSSVSLMVMTGSVTDLSGSAEDEAVSFQVPGRLILTEAVKEPHVWSIVSI